MNRLQKVQNFLSEYNQELFDFIDMPPHQLHGKQAEQMANDFIKNAVSKPAVVQNDHIHSERPSIQTLVTRLKELRNRISGISNELPVGKPQGSHKLSPEEMDQLKQKWNKLSQSRTDQTPSLFTNPETSASNLIKPKENLAYYTSLAQKRKETVVEEVIGRIGPTTSSDLSALYMQKIKRDESTPEGKEETNTRISRIRDLIHGRIKAGMEDAARQYGSASIRTSENHGNPFDIQAQNDLRHAQIKMQRHNAQLQRFVGAHHALAMKGAEDKFLTGDEMRRLTILGANLTKRQLGQIKQAVLSAQTEGEVGEVF